jgi:hypothetical protein
MALGLSVSTDWGLLGGGAWCSETWGFNISVRLVEGVRPANVSQTQNEHSSFRRPALSPRKASSKEPCLCLV